MPAVRRGDRCDRAGKRADTVTALEHVRDGSAAVLPSDAANRRRDRRGGLDADAEVAYRIARDVVEAGAHDDQFGCNGARRRRQQHLPERDEGFGRHAARRQRHVDDDVVAKAVAARAGARVGGRGVGGDVGQAVAGDCLRPVAVVVIEIGDEHSPTSRTCGDGRIIEDAEAHAARRLGVVPRRTHEGEDALAAGEAGLDGGHRAARRAHGNAVRRFVDERVAGGELAHPACRRGFALHQLEVAAGMHAQNFFGGRISGGDALGEDPALAKERRDRLYAFGPLRVAGGAEVIAVEGVGNELQPECFDPLQASEAALLTSEYAFVPFFIIGSSRL